MPPRPAESPVTENRGLEREKAHDFTRTSRTTEEPAGRAREPFLLAAGVRACNSVTTTPRQLIVHPRAQALPRQTLFNLHSARLSAFFSGEACRPRASFPVQQGQCERSIRNSNTKGKRAEEQVGHEGAPEPWGCGQQAQRGGIELGHLRGLHQPE